MSGSPTNSLCLWWVGRGWPVLSVNGENWVEFGDDVMRVPWPKELEALKKKLWSSGESISP